MVSTRSSSALTPAPTSSPRNKPAKSTSIDIEIPLSSIPTTLTHARTSPRSPKSILRSSTSPTPPSTWSHTPTPLTLLWLTISLPLVAWDTGYILLRPRSMPGGSLHWPLWVPYDLYGRVDHVYGFKAWDAGMGFTAAQGMLNLVETIGYVVYWGLWVRYGTVVGDAGVDGKEGVGLLGAKGKGMSGRRRVAGRAGGLAVTVGFATAVMTFSKTVLYWLNEYYSGFDNIGHNPLKDLILLWIIPNGLWLIFPAYMIYVLGLEIVDGLAGTSDAAIKNE